MAQSLHVIGGGAGIGRWLLDRVFPSAAKTYCYDTDTKALESLPPTITPCLLADSGYAPFSSQFQPEDLILLALPFTVFEATIIKLIPLLKPGSLVATLSSNQAEPLSILKKHLPEDCTFCGCHALFGTAVSSPAGQLVAITEFNGEHPQHRALRSLLEAKGLIVTTLSAEEHDHYMSYVQALTHFTLIGFAATLVKDGVHLRDLLDKQTPNFKFLHALASRVIKIAPTTTGAIQTTPEASRIRASMLETLRGLHEQFESAKTTESCAAVIEKLRAPLTGAEVDEGAEISIAADERLQDFEEVLYKYESSGSPFVFRQRTTRQLRAVRIMDIRPDEIDFEEATKLVQRDGRTYLAIALNEIARKNYSAMGLNVPNPLRISMKKRNIKLLDREELDAFYHTSVLPVVIDRNFSNPHGMEETYFEEWLPLVVRGLWRCEFLHSFRKRGAVEKITLRLSFNPSHTRDGIVAQVRSVIEEPAGRRRSQGSP